MNSSNSGKSKKPGQLRKRRWISHFFFKGDPGTVTYLNTDGSKKNVPKPCLVQNENIPQKPPPPGSTEEERNSNEENSKNQQKLESPLLNDCFNFSNQFSDVEDSDLVDFSDEFSNFEFDISID